MERSHQVQAMETFEAGRKSKPQLEVLRSSRFMEALASLMAPTEALIERLNTNMLSFFEE